MTTPAAWDAQAADFDAEPDHGLTDPAVRAAWRELLTPLLPPAPARVLDLGCGTGSLAVLLAGAGRDVMDRTPARAVSRRRPPWGRSCTTHVRYPQQSLETEKGKQDNSNDKEPQQDPGQELRPSAPPAAQVTALARACRQEADVVPLTDPALWGRVVDDERYLVLSRH